MKNTFLFLTTLLLLSCGGSKTDSTNKTAEAPVKVVPAPDLSKKYAQTITAEELKEMLYTYASDEFEGRDTGEPGQKLAVNFLKDQYMAMGVASPLGNNDYFQEVPLQKLMMPTIKVTAQGKVYDQLQDVISLRGAEPELITTDQIVYAGYGIDDENYSDYKNIEVKNKVVLVKYGEPTNADGSFVTSGQKESTKWSSGRQAMSSKRNAAMERGAKALLILSEKDYHERLVSYYQRLKERGGFGNISLDTQDEDNFMHLSVSEDLAKSLYPDILTNSEPKVIDRLVSIDYYSEKEEVDSENVVAFIKGSEYPNEVLVISSHLDHVGIEDGQIYNGADDDGSGTIAIVEIAEAFQQAVKDGFEPKRSILFLHVTAEEKGLLGSRYYTDQNPVFPLENTVANLNIDMIGRTDPKREGNRNYVYLIGSDRLSQELHNLSEEVNKDYANIELDYKYNDENDPNRFYYRSDHYNFAKNNIPVIFYFNGTHDDYHQPSDTPDKIEYDLLENRARLIFHTAWEIANRDKRLIVDKEIE